MRIFVDTSAFIALTISSERWHEKVVEKYQSYVEENAFFYTSYLILNELYTRLIYDFGKREFARAIKVIKDIESEERLQIFEIDPVLFKKSEKIMIKFLEHKISFIDATTYVCVKEFNLDEVFTLDSDFKKIGLKSSF